MAATDASGMHLCNASLELSIKEPASWRAQKMTTKQQQLQTTSTCAGEAHVTNEPDYIARYTPSKAGTYRLTLKNTDTGKYVKSTFVVVKDKPRILMARQGAVRMVPSNQRYPMVIRLTASSDFNGTLSERIPNAFHVAWSGPADVEATESHQVLRWDVTLKAGETKQLAYEVVSAEMVPLFTRIPSLTLVDNDGKNIDIGNAEWQVLQAQ
jgi:hypothetical protein